MTSPRIQADLLALALFLIGILLVLGAHWALNKAEERSRELYEQIVGPEHAQDEIESAWIGGKPVVGHWGCVVIVLQVLRGLGVLLAIGALVYWLAGG
jgi:hypothetical protein